MAGYWKIRKNFTFFITFVLLIVACLCGIFYSTRNLYETSVVLPPVSAEQHVEVLHAQSFGKGVHIFHNVCVVLDGPTNEKSTVGKRGLSEKETKKRGKIIVYNSEYDKIGANIVVNESRHIDQKFKSWNVDFSKENIPKNYHFVSNTAIFVMGICPGNLHHFWEDAFLYILYTLNATNNLYPGAENYVLYKSAWDEHPKARCHDVWTYGDILSTLDIYKNHDVFYRAVPQSTCFSHAIFGLLMTSPVKNNHRIAVDYVSKQLGLSTVKDCPQDAEMKVVVTVIARRKRRILNLKSIVHRLSENASLFVQVVAFENCTVREQVKIAMCSDVLIGVQGAGLQWGMFMKRNSLVVEIAWPKSFWHFYYKSISKRYALRHRGIEARKVFVNWDVYEQVEIKELKLNKSLGEEEKTRLLQSSRNAWKWADVEVDEVAVYKAVCET